MENKLSSIEEKLDSLLESIDKDDENRRAEAGENKEQPNGAR